MNSLVFVNADDFGWTDGHNRAVALAHRSGSLQRASLLCNGEAFQDAIRLSNELPTLQVGIHLTLNEGQPLLPAQHLPKITRRDGKFYDGLYSVFMLWLSGGLNSTEVESEWRAQIERALGAGLVPSHLDSHKHVHMLPPLVKIATELAKEYGIAYMRLPLENFPLRRGLAGMMLWTFSKFACKQMSLAGLSSADRFIGVGSSGHMHMDELIEAIRESPPGLTEIMVHPAVITPDVQRLQKRYRWAAQYEFEEELQTLLSLGNVARLTLASN